MRQIFNSYSQRITAVFLGHDHMTEFLDFGSVPAIVAGSGREARNEGPIYYTEGGFQIATQYLAPQAQHWVRLDISEDASEATATIVRVSDQKRICTAQFRSKIMSLLGECASRLN